MHNIIRERRRYMITYYSRNEIENEIIFLDLVVSESLIDDVQVKLGELYELGHVDDEDLRDVIREVGEM